MSRHRACIPRDTPAPICSNFTLILPLYNQSHLRRRARLCLLFCYYCFSSTCTSACKSSMLRHHSAPNLQSLPNLTPRPGTSPFLHQKQLFRKLKSFLLTCPAGLHRLFNEVNFVRLCIAFLAQKFLRLFNLSLPRETLDHLSLFLELSFKHSLAFFHLLQVLLPLHIHFTFCNSFSVLDS